MIRSSAAELSTMRPAVSSGESRFADDERYYDELMSGEGNTEAEMDQLVDALALELEQDIASMNPVNVHTGQVYKSQRQLGPKPAYDPWDDQALDEFMAEFEREGVDPVVDQFGVLPPHGDEVEAEGEAPNGRRRLMTAVAAGVLVVAMGFAGWAFLGSSGGFGEAVVVRAPEGPYKVKPDPNAQEVVASAEGATVYDSVGGTPAKSEERLVTRSGDVPELPAVTPHVSRITLPDGQEIEAELPTGFDPNETGPRRVRTVLVRPDGSLIETPDTTASVSSAAPAPANDGTAQIIAQNEEADTSSGLPPLSANNQTIAADAPAQVAGLPASNLTDASGQAMPINLSNAPKPADAAVASPAAAAAPVDAAAAAMNAPLPPVKPMAPAAAPTSGPLDLTTAASSPQPAAQPIEVASAAPAAPAPVASSGGAGAYVQLSSQRSEEAARSAFAALQRKFPSVLGSATVDIQQADLGTKGVYYRARVGAPSRDAAVALCEQLRAAGGDCLIAR